MADATEKTAVPVLNHGHRFDGTACFQVDKIKVVGSIKPMKLIKELYEWMMIGMGLLIIVTVLYFDNLFWGNNRFETEQEDDLAL